MVYGCLWKRYQTIVDGCEILHLLIDGLSHYLMWVSSILLIVQDFETIHSSNRVRHWIDLRDNVQATSIFDDKNSCFLDQRNDEQQNNL